MSDHDGPNLTETGYRVGEFVLLGQVSRNSALGAEYQRQQLNLLREHQGLPPVPPAPRVNYAGEALKAIAFIFFLILVVGGAFGIILSILSSPHY